MSVILVREMPFCSSRRDRVKFTAKAVNRKLLNLNSYINLH
jgi:hypothetical protein